MSPSRTTGFLVAGTILAGVGGLAAQSPAGAAVSPTTIPVGTTGIAPTTAASPSTTPAVAPTSPETSFWHDTSFPVPAGVLGTAQLVASTADRELVDWTVAPKQTTGPWTSALAVIEHGAHLTGTAQVPWFVATPPTIATSGQGLVLGTTYKSYESTGLGWATVSKTGKVGRLTPLTKAPLNENQGVSLAANAKGQAVAAWAEGGANPVVRAALRRSGTGRFGKPFTVSLPGATELSGVSAAIDASGHVVVIYGARPKGKTSALQAIWGSRGVVSGSSLRNIGVAGPEEGNPVTSASFASGGRLDIAWGAQLGGEQADSPYVVRAASLGRKAATFSAEQVLDKGGAKAPPAGGPQIVPGPGTSSLVAWTGVNASGAQPVKVATSNPSGQFGDPQTLAPNGRLGGIAWSTAASFVTLAAGADEPRSTLSAALRFSGGSFSSPSAVATLPTDENWYAEPFGSLKPAPVISPAHLLDASRVMLAHIENGAGGKPALVLTQYPLG